MHLLLTELFLDLNVRNLLCCVDFLLVELLDVDDELQHQERGEDRLANK
jgi:hypothetical protein